MGAKRTKEVSAYETVASAKSEKTATGCLAALYKAKSERQGNVALVPVRAAFWIKDRP